MSSIIQVENLGKKYVLSHQSTQRYTALRDVITNSVKQWGKKIIYSSGEKKTQDSQKEEFWALKNVSFEIKQGDKVGIIGRNGAGKSTLLKILSRISEPTIGKITLRGRVASLLEVGTGFHPELTGRENIYLNGAILGMTKSDINNKFDEIVEFAEVEKFLDTPVKRYSSGMHVRLAFAVAAHLEPEILIIDEVLAVGDMQFQKKCLGKMGNIGREGRTILFVSHNMSAVNNLCNSAILLTNGQITSSGSISSVVQDYMKQNTIDQSKKEYVAHNEEFGVTILNIDVINSEGVPAVSIATGDLIAFRILVKTKQAYENLAISIGVNSYNGMRVTVFHTNITNADLSLDKPFSAFLCIVPKLSLLPGRYVLDIKIINDPDVLFWIPSAVEIDVQSGDFYGTGRLPDSDWGGVCALNHQWQGVAFEDLDDQIELSSQAICRTMQIRI